MLRAFIAGLVATAVMSVVALMAPLMGMPPMDFGDMLGTQNPMVQMPYAMGWIMHFMVGVVLAMVYGMFVSHLPGPAWLSGVLFAMLPFVIAQSALMPMMGKGFWSGGDMGLLMGSFIGHVVFGAVLGLIVGKKNNPEA